MLSPDKIKLHIKNLRDFAAQRIFSFDPSTLNAHLQQILVDMQKQLAVENLSIKKIRAIYKDACETAKKFQVDVDSTSDKAFVDALSAAVKFGKQELLAIYNKKNEKFSELVANYTALSNEMQLHVSQFQTTRDIINFEEMVSQDYFFSNIDYVDQTEQKKPLYNFFADILRQNRTSILPNLFIGKLKEDVSFTKESFLQFIIDDPGFIDEIINNSNLIGCFSTCYGAIDREVFNTMLKLRPDSAKKIRKFFVSLLSFQLSIKVVGKNFKESDLIALFDKESMYLVAMLKLRPALFCNFISDKLYDKVQLMNPKLISAVEHFSHLAQISLWPSDIRDVLTILAPKNFQILIDRYKEFDFLIVCPQLYPILSVKFWVKSGLEIQTMDFELKENGAVAFLSSRGETSSLLYPNIKLAFAYVARIAHFLNHVDQIKIVVVKETLLYKDQKNNFEKKNINIVGKNFILETKQIIDNFDEQPEVSFHDDSDNEINSTSDPASDQDDYIDDDFSEGEESSSPSFP